MLTYHVVLPLYCFCRPSYREIIGHSDTSLRILKDIHGSMADNGVLVASMGFSPTSSSPSAETDSANGFHKALIEVGFESVLDYEEVRHYLYWSRCVLVNVFVSLARLNSILFLLPSDKYVGTSWI